MGVIALRISHLLPRRGLTAALPQHHRPPSLQPASITAGVDLHTGARPAAEQARRDSNIAGGCSAQGPRTSRRHTWQGGGSLGWKGRPAGTACNEAGEEPTTGQTRRRRCSNRAGLLTGG